MIKWWPINKTHNFLFSFNKNRMVEELDDCDFQGIELEASNDILKDKYRLIGTYVISNWNDE